MAHFAAAKRHQINLRRALVRDFVDVGDGERDEIAFRRDLGIADAANLQQIVDREAALLRMDQRQSKQTDNRDSKETFHNYLEEFVQLCGKAARIIALVRMIRESALALFDIQTRAVRLKFQHMTELTNEGSITLRPASTADDDLFLQLYQSSRGDDLRGLGWDEDRISEFLEMQYEAQVSFYATDFPNASDEIVLWEANPVGRLIVDRRADEIRLVDIALLPGHRNRGFGSQIVRGLQAEAAAQHKPLRLQVIRFNRALGLFERLGFVRVSETGTHFQMEWISEDRPRGPQTGGPAGAGQ